MATFLSQFAELEKVHFLSVSNSAPKPLKKEKNVLRNVREILSRRRDFCDRASARRAFLALNPKFCEEETALT